MPRKLPNKRERQIYSAMMQRCYNPKDDAYRNYGGRGITVCQRWREDVENFISDMGPSNGLSIERVKNDEGYSKENCIWASRVEQNNNRRNNRLIEHDGMVMTIAQWSRHTGISEATLWMRLRRGNSNLFATYNLWDKKPINLSA